MYIIYDEKLDKFIEFSIHQEFELTCYYIYTYYNHNFNREEFIHTLELNRHSNKLLTKTQQFNKRKVHYQKNIRNVKPKYY